MIRVLFFAELREQLQCSEIALAENGFSSVAELRQQLVNVNPAWEEYLGATHLLVAVNQTLVKSTHAVSDNDEVAFFPPVTGG